MTEIKTEAGKAWATIERFLPKDGSWLEERSTIRTALSLQDELVEALEGLEAANNGVCSLRSSEQYAVMLKLGQHDALIDLDEARRRARSLLTRIRKG